MPGIYTAHVYARLQTRESFSDESLQRVVRASESASRLCVSALRQSNNSVQLERRVELTSTAWNSAPFAAGYSRVRNSRLRVVSSRQIQRAYARARGSDERQRGERQALSVIVHAGYLHKIGTILFACCGECGGEGGESRFLSAML